MPYPIIRDRVDDLMTVSDAEVLAAAALLRRRGFEAEPSGAVALAGAIRAGRGTGRSVAVVSGGNTTAALTAAAAAAAASPSHRATRTTHTARSLFEEIS